MKNKKKFLDLVSSKDEKTLEKIKWRNANRQWLQDSQKIAFKILYKLDQLGWSQKDLAEKMEVSPQQINKIVRGNENLTLQSLKKLQEVLNIPLLASYYENKLDIIDDLIKTFKIIEEYVAKTNQPSGDYTQSKIIKLETVKHSKEPHYQLVG